MSVASKNLFDLLGNDADGDSDSPAAPVKTVDKTSTHTSKRNGDGNAPVKSGPSGGSQRSRGGFSANEQAFRDRAVGSDRNRARNTDEAPRGGPRGGRGARGRGGRGATYHQNRDDRHAKNLASGGGPKQGEQAWGATEGQAELKDEQAGDAIAQTEQKDAEASPEEPKEEEPEDKTISFEDYQHQIEEKRRGLEANLAIRKPNEGVSSKEEKKWAGAKALSKDDDDNYMVLGGKASKQRDRVKDKKTTLELDNTWHESSDRPRGGRGGRGGHDGPRGDRRGGRGGSRGGAAPRGGGAPRGAGAPRGGAARGGRHENQAPLNTNDTSAFPSLGK